MRDVAKITEDEIDSIAQAVHGNWVKELVRQGTTNAGDSWEKLHEQSRELFRVSVRTTLAKLLRGPKAEPSERPEKTRVDVVALVRRMVTGKWKSVKVMPGFRVPEALADYLADLCKTKDGEQSMDETFLSILLVGYAVLMVGGNELSKSDGRNELLVSIGDLIEASTVAGVSLRQLYEG